MPQAKGRIQIVERIKFVTRSKERSVQIKYVSDAATLSQGYNEEGYKKSVRRQPFAPNAHSYFHLGNSEKTLKQATKSTCPFTLTHTCAEKGKPSAYTQ